MKKILLIILILLIPNHLFSEQERVKSEKDVMIGDKHPYIQGAWFWKVDEGELDEAKDLKGFEPQGVFLLEYENGAVKGLSIVEAPLAANPDNMKSVMYKAPLKGTATKNADGTSKFTFIVDSSEGNKTNSTATLSKDGRSMTGVSESLIKRNDGTSLQVKYSWKAKRP